MQIVALVQRLSQSNLQDKKSIQHDSGAQLLSVWTTDNQSQSQLQVLKLLKQMLGELADRLRLSVRDQNYTSVCSLAKLWSSLYPHLSAGACKRLCSANQQNASVMTHVHGKVLVPFKAGKDGAMTVRTVLAEAHQSL